jgi:hypothetical protein
LFNAKAFTKKQKTKVMETTPAKKGNYTKLAIGAAITFTVVVLALAAYDKGIKPMLEKKPKA